MVWMIFGETGSRRDSVRIPDGVRCGAALSPPGSPGDPRFFYEDVRILNRSGVMRGAVSESGASTVPGRCTGKTKRRTRIIIPIRRIIRSVDPADALQLV